MAKNEVVVKDYTGLSYDQLSQISRDDHQEDTRQYDTQQNALCLVMIGAICAVCAILFFVLSFRRSKNKLVGIDPTSLQFFVCIGCVIAAAVLLSIGLVRFFKARKVRKDLEVEIMTVTNLKNKLAAALEE